MIEQLLQPVAREDPRTRIQPQQEIATGLLRRVIAHGNPRLAGSIVQDLNLLTADLLDHRQPFTGSLVQGRRRQQQHFEAASQRRVLQQGFDAALEVADAAFQGDQDTHRGGLGMPVIETITARRRRQHRDLPLRVTAGLQVAFQHSSLVGAITQRQGLADQQRLGDMPHAAQALLFDQAKLVLQLEGPSAVEGEAALLQQGLALVQPVPRQARRETQQQVEVEIRSQCDVGAAVGRAHRFISHVRQATGLGTDKLECRYQQARGREFDARLHDQKPVAPAVLQRSIDGFSLPLPGTGHMPYLRVGQRLVAEHADLKVRVQAALRTQAGQGGGQALAIISVIQHKHTDDRHRLAVEALVDQAQLLGIRVALAQPGQHAQVQVRCFERPRPGSWQ
ncbi:hypothetical protein NWF32_18790 [Pseudomonas qingdaonensis]|nr:hypothetical protein [Pseudomonas qingdaonensis]